MLPSKCSVESKIYRLVKINFQLTFGICRATCLKIGYFHLTDGRVEYEFRSLAIGLSINLAAAHHITTFKRKFPEQYIYIYSESRILTVITLIAPDEGTIGVFVFYMGTHLFSFSFPSNKHFCSTKIRDSGGFLDVI